MSYFNMDDSDYNISPEKNAFIAYNIGFIKQFKNLVIR